MKRIGSIFFSLCFLTAPLTAWSQEGVAPSYITSLSPYEVRSLSEAFAPANGKVSMEDITPAEWLGGLPIRNLPDVIAAWNGGAKGIGNQLFVHGGGHYGSANNGMYTFDFSGTTKPRGWDIPLDISSVADVRESSDQYADGRPTSVHTYDGMVYASHNHHVYRFMGAWYSPFGNFTAGSWKYQVATKTWTFLGDYPGESNAAITIYDPTTGKIFVTGEGVWDGYFFRTATDSWSGPKNQGVGDFGFYDVGAWDPSRSRGVVVGGANLVLNLDFSAETVLVSSFTATGDTAILNANAISIVYDPHRDVYWMFGGNWGIEELSNSPGWSTIYEMNADGPPWRITAHPLGGDSMAVGQQWGSYGRFIFMDKWRAIGLVARHTSPAYVIKLPGEVVHDTTPPSPPGNLEIH